MRLNLYRQLRLVVILVAGIGILTTLVALTVAYRSEVLQREFLDSLTQDEFQELLEHLQEHPGAPLPRSSQLTIWMDGHPDSDPLPPALHALREGYHHDVTLQEGVYHVLKTHALGYPTYVAIETSSFASHERWLQGALVGVALLDIPLALLMGIWLVRRISVPHEQLAERVRELDPASDPEPISPDFHGIEVGQIAQAIDSYQDRLQGFVRRERSFTAAASHELRTPLASILTSAELLHHDRQLPAPLKNYTSQLIRNANQLGELLNGLMWFAREKDLPRREPVDVEAMARELVKQISEAGRTVEIIDQQAGQARETVRLPVVLFSIVFSNLLRNALQFSPEGSRVTVTLDERQFCIHNPGPAIPEHDLGHIFEPHFRSRSSPGQGLGLYIASTICQRLDWDLEISSNEGQGTRVSVTL